VAPDDPDAVAVADADGHVVEQDLRAGHQAGLVERDEGGRRRGRHQPGTGPSGPGREVADDVGREDADGAGAEAGDPGTRWGTIWQPGTGPRARTMSPVGPLAASPTDRSIASACDPTRKATVGPLPETSPALAPSSSPTSRTVASTGCSETAASCRSLCSAAATSSVSIRRRAVMSASDGWGEDAPAPDAARNRSHSP